MSFAAVLTLIFITLKLTKAITWAWIWVLSPTWIPLALVATLFAIVFIGKGLLGIHRAIGQSLKSRRKLKSMYRNN